jgi:uncharacterized membrane protein
MLNLLGKLLPSFDLVVALGLVAIAAVVFIGSRMGVLPKRSVGVVTGALLAIFGVFLFQRGRRRALERQARELEDRIKRRDQELARWRESFRDSMARFHEAGAALDAQLAATSTELALTLATNREERDRIDRMSPDEVFEWLRKQPIRETAAGGGNGQ